MSALEKIFKILSIIKEHKDIAPTDMPFEISIVRFIFTGLDESERETIFDKLVQDFKVLSDWKMETGPIGGTKILAYYFMPTRKFDSFYEEFKDKNIHLTQNNNPMLWLTYTNTRELLLNDIFLITTTRYNSINDKLLSYLSQHPNKTVQRKELEEQKVLDKDKKEDKDFYVFLEDIKITGDLRKLFFGQDLSKHSLHLRNPIPMEVLKEHGIKHINLSKSLSNNKTSTREPQAKQD